MAIEEQIRGVLIANAGVTALVAERIYPSERVPPSALLPRVVYSVVSEMASQELAGISKYSVARWQFDCLASDYTTAKTIARKLRDVMCAINGSVGGGFVVRGCVNPNIFDGNDLPQDGTAIGISRVILEVQVGFEEP